MDPDDSSPEARVEALRRATGARAAGWWRASADGLRLDLVAFAAAPDMPEAVASGFSGATRSVPLSAGSLGIVKAATTGAVAVSRAEELPPGEGSGYWLRAFGAARSVAVPLPDGHGLVRAVVSIALEDTGPGDEAAARAVLKAVASWPLTGVRLP